MNTQSSNAHAESSASGASSQQASGSAIVPKRACDQCNIRRIRCTPSEDPRIQDCLACQKSGYSCESIKPHKPRGPKPTRLNVLRGSRASSDGSSQATPSKTARPHPYDVSSASNVSTSAQVLHDGQRYDEQPQLPIINYYQPPTATSMQLPPNAPNSNETVVSSLPGSNLHMGSPFDPFQGITPPTPQSNPGIAFSNGSPHPYRPSAAFDPPSMDIFQGAASAQGIPGTDIESLLATWPGASASMGSDTFGLPFLDWDFTAMVTSRQPTRPGSPVDGTSRPQYENSAKINDYFTHFHPMFPVLDRYRIETAFAQGEHRSSPSLDALRESILALLEVRDTLVSQPTADRDSVPSPSGQRLRTLSESMAWQAGMQLNIDTVMVAFHLFVVYEMLGATLASWVRLQEALTLAQTFLPGEWKGEMGAEKSEELRLYYLLFIAERGVALLKGVPTHLIRPLRLPDDAYGTTADIRSRVPAEMLADFPIAHLRLFSLARSEYLSCWRGMCGGRCDIWTDDKVSKLQDELRNEQVKAKEEWNSRSTKPSIEAQIQLANLIVTIAWFRDRFWNIGLHHNLATFTTPLTPNYTSILDNATETIEFVTSIRETDLDIGLDFAAKLYDMARTIISVIQILRVQSDQDSRALEDRCRALNYKILGILSTLGRDPRRLMPSLIKALADII